MTLPELTLLWRQNLTFHSTDNGVRVCSFLGRAMVGENADVYSGPGMGIYPFNARISWLNASGPGASNGPRGTAWLLLDADIFDLANPVMVFIGLFEYGDLQLSSSGFQFTHSLHGRRS